MIRLAAVALAALIVGLTCQQSIAQSPPFPERLDIQITQEPSSSGPVYRVDFSPFSLFSEGTQLVAPEGRVFEDNLFGRVDRQAVDLSFTELQELLIGDWNLFDRFDFFTPTEQSEQHTFSIDPFTVADLFTETPTITTPSEGATVPPSFVVEWEYAPGVDVPSGRTASVGGAAGGVDFENLTQFSYRLDIGLEPGVTKDEISVRVGNSMDLGSFISEIEPVGDTSRLFEPSLRIASFSARRTLFVAAVPEPASGLVLAMMGAGVLGWRRKF